MNDEKTSVDYVVQNNDFISHTVHRHELPVTGHKIRVIHEDDDWVVVDKPASIPVHPCGRYRHNTVIFILAKELGFKKIHTVHRLDRLTSGKDFDSIFNNLSVAMLFRNIDIQQDLSQGQGDGAADQGEGGREGVHLQSDGRVPGA